MFGHDPPSEEIAPVSVTGCGAGPGAGAGDGAGVGAGAGGGGGGGAGAAACAMAAAFPAMLIVAERAVCAGFAATTTLTEPWPCPAFGLAWTHVLSLVTLQVQSRVVETVAAKVVPEKGTELGIPVTCA